MAERWVFGFWVVDISAKTMVRTLFFQGSRVQYTGPKRYHSLEGGRELSIEFGMRFSQLKKVRRMGIVCAKTLAS